MSNTSGKFSCSGCGKSYPWKPEIAGRQARCKCGAILQVPHEPPPVEATPETAAPQPPANQCPSCQQPIAADAVLCVNCGYNLRTGQHMAAAVAAGSPAPAPSAPSAPAARKAAAKPKLNPYPGYERPAADEPEGTPVKKYILLGLLLLVVATGIGGFIIYRGMGGADANKPRLGKDGEVFDLMEEQSATEAQKWLDEVNARMLSGMTRNAASGFIKRLYQKGAVKVSAFGKGVLCMKLAVELPRDPAQRKELFKWQDDWHAGDSEAFQKDVGQQYLLVFLKL